MNLWVCSQLSLSYFDTEENLKIWFFEGKFCTFFFKDSRGFMESSSPVTITLQHLSKLMLKWFKKSWLWLCYSDLSLLALLKTTAQTRTQQQLVLLVTSIRCVLVLVWSVVFSRVLAGADSSSENRRPESHVWVCSCCHVPLMVWSSEDFHIFTHMFI